VNPPVYHASTILSPSYAAFEASRKPGYEGYRYGRYGTPTSRALDELSAALDHTDHAISVSSGLAAISCAILAFVEAGSHILVSDSAYEPTRTFCNSILARFGVETEYYDPRIGAGIERLIRPETRIIYMESPGSHSFEIQDVPAIAEVARTRGIKTIIDNTWATPIYFKPITKGVNVVVYAATKYQVGHSDAMMGIIAMGDEDRDAIRDTVRRLGNTAGPDDVYLTMRGMRTMAVRLRHHMAAGMEMARWLRDRPEVERVIHPALEDHPDHALWKRDFTGASGLFGTVFKPCSDAAFAAFFDALELHGLGASWGGFESLVLPANLAKSRTAVPWKDNGRIVRFHTGLEDLDDLKADVEQGFAAMKAVG
ncbi:MAG: cystathionine beta-lyase, partial [Rhodospirillaceae bacterium]|nr:cystathionine beta-lyase [Rhodospirillaceae bacterium]